MVKNHPDIPNRRADTDVADAVRVGKQTAGQGDYSETLNTLSRRGVPRAVIERIFVYRQCCRSTDTAANNTASKQAK